MQQYLFILGGLLIVLYFLYVSIITKKNKCKEALAGIDVQLQQRFNLIPNILQIAKRFMEHETELFAEIVALREKASSNYNKKDPEAIKQHFESIEQMSSKMNGLIMKVENYPNLKSDQTMVNVQKSYSDVEYQIAAARRFYNSAVNDFENAIQIFPGNLVAKLLGVKEMPFYQADELAKNTVNAKDFL